MAQAHSQDGIPRAWHEVSAALFALRDALVELSLLLKDMQFETDREERNEAEATFRQLLKKIGSNQGPADFSGQPRR